MASTVPSLLAFFLSCALLLAKALPTQTPTPSPSSTAPSCTDELVLFSPCLSYVASPPNDLDDAASASCCNAFHSAADSGVAVCFCYLLQKPPILGFPLNSSRLFSLSSDCRRVNRTSRGAPSLNSLCSESPALPPLTHSATLGLTTPTTTTAGRGLEGSRSRATPEGVGGGGGRASGGGSSGGLGGGGGRSSGNRGGGNEESRPTKTQTPRRGGGTSGVTTAGAHGHPASSVTRICSSRSWLPLALTLNMFVSLLTIAL